MLRGVAVEVAEEAGNGTQIDRCAPRESVRARASQRGWVRTMNASPIFTPVRSRAAQKLRASATVVLNGFSHRTCLPASAALIDHGTCRLIRKWIVDRVDFRVGQQSLHTSRKTLGMPSFCAASSAFRSIARGDRRDFAPFALLHPRDGAAHGDRRDTQHSPANFSRISMIPGYPRARHPA